jgi:hypothetical protein
LSSVVSGTALPCDLREWPLSGNGDRRFTDPKATLILSGSGPSMLDVALKSGLRRTMEFFAR